MTHWLKKLVVLVLFPLVCSLLSGCFPGCFLSLISKEQRQILHWQVCHFCKLQLIRTLIYPLKAWDNISQQYHEFIRKMFCMLHRKLCFNQSKGQSMNFCFETMFYLCHYYITCFICFSIYVVVHFTHVLLTVLDCHSLEVHSF